MQKQTVAIIILVMLVVDALLFLRESKRERLNVQSVPKVFGQDCEAGGFCDKYIRIDCGEPMAPRYYAVRRSGNLLADCERGTCPPVEWSQCMNERAISK